jgi:hypothetical protein
LLAEQDVALLAVFLTVRQYDSTSACGRFAKGAHDDNSLSPHFATLTVSGFGIVCGDNSIILLFNTAGCGSIVQAINDPRGF